MMNAIKKTVFALVAVTITAGFLWHTSRVVAPRAATWNDVLAEARQGGYAIIDTDALWDRYQKDPDTLFLVDTRQEWEYRTGHIKGALNFPMEPTWLSRWRNKGALEKFLGADENRFIVFY
jgi:3-mercaptopyruvate sulfurtransferase SseA